MEALFRYRPDHGKMSTFCLVSAYRASGDSGKDRATDRLLSGIAQASPPTDAADLGMV